mmetsp:Transcript_6818/g.7904  ORF Transcript_6818/g.7904 Transcript_6818/m.7904 type:complete len:256 (-) Transcript_6818:1563-2330(-)
MRVNFLIWFSTIGILPIYTVASSSSSPVTINQSGPTTRIQCETGIRGGSTSSSESRSLCSNTIDFTLPPFVPPLVLIDSQVKSVPIETATPKRTDHDHADGSFDLSDVYGCCKPIGTMTQMTTAQSLVIFQATRRGWNNGAGTWTQMTLRERVDRMRLFVTELTKQREKIIHTLMWEIGKNYEDAAAEFDRTIQFINQTMDLVLSSDEFNPTLFADASSTTKVFSKRNAIGIMLCLGPYNYPINETYATLIPALL